MALARSFIRTIAGRKRLTHTTLSRPPYVLSSPLFPTTATVPPLSLFHHCHCSTTAPLFKPIPLLYQNRHRGIILDDGSLSSSRTPLPAVLSLPESTESESVVITNYTIPKGGRRRKSFFFLNGLEVNRVVVPVESHFWYI